jgi:CDK inhibitor PHO81
MKFGKHIQQVSQEWATPYYLNYKDLKKIIKSDNPKTLFFYQLERELEKVNNFYLQKEHEFVIRLQALEKKLTNPTIGLKQGKPFAQMPVNSLTV